MRGGGLKIGRVFGIPIYLHTSWFFIFFLITYSFAVEFSSLNPNWSETQRWTAGLLTSLLFFGSVLFHELSHSVVALRYRIPVKSITLFIFGGVASISRDPDRPGQEFLIAAAGPLSSFALAAGFWLLAAVSPSASIPYELGRSLRNINAGLAVFNLLPGFPLDGGRLLRSIVWGINKNYARATRIAARSGQVIAYLMIALGLFSVWQPSLLGGDMLGGLWLAFIGWFLLSAARSSYTQISVRGVLEGLRAADIMSAEMSTVGRDMSLEEYGQEVARTGRRAHLVVSDGQLVGLMTVEALQAVPREEWPMTSVQAVMVSRDRVQWAAPEEPAMELLDRMRRTEVDQMAVINDGNVVGLVTRDSVQRALEVRSEFAHPAGR
jgi:Zn-dependent protease/predicted transcriptional regulator